jgi:hypothetical protein
MAAALDQQQIEERWQSLQKEVQRAEDQGAAVRLLRKYVENVERELRDGDDAPHLLVEHVQEALEQIAFRHEAVFEAARLEEATGFIPIDEEM